MSFAFLKSFTQFFFVQFWPNFSPVLVMTLGQFYSSFSPVSACFGPLLVMHYVRCSLVLDQFFSSFVGIMTPEELTIYLIQEESSRKHKKLWL